MFGFPDWFIGLLVGLALLQLAIWIPLAWSGARLLSAAAKLIEAKALVLLNDPKNPATDAPLPKLGNAESDSRYRPKN